MSGKGAERPTGRDDREARGQRLRDLVEEHWHGAGGISGLARELEVSRATVHAWYRGDSVPSTATLLRLAEVLGVPDVVSLVGHTPAAARRSRFSMRCASPTFARFARSSSSVDDDALQVRGSPWDAALPGGAPIRSMVAGRVVLECRPDDRLGEVARRMVARGYSQVPVRGARSAIEALLTTDTIARCLASRRGTDIDATTVSDALAHAERSSDFVVVGPATSAIEVALWFEERVRRGEPLAAVLVTDTGQASGRLVGIVTAVDLPRLRGHDSAGDPPGTL